MGQLLLETEREIKRVEHQLELWQQAYDDAENNPYRQGNAAMEIADLTKRLAALRKYLGYLKAKGF